MMSFCTVGTFILCHVVCLTVPEVNWLLVLVSTDLFRDYPCRDLERYCDFVGEPV